MNTQVIEFLTKNANSNKAQITEATGIKGLQLFNVLKQMVKDGQIKTEGEGSETTYAIVVDDKESTVEGQTGTTSTDLEVQQAANAEDVAEMTNIVGESTEIKADSVGTENVNAGVEGNVPPAPEQSVEKEKASSGRDNSKLTFNGESYGKGPFVRAVVAKYVEDHPTVTFKQLNEVFPEKLLNRFAIFRDEAKAKEISGKRDRYFMKPEHLIKLKDKTIAICSQFTFENVQPFLKVARELGYDIK